MIEPGYFVLSIVMSLILIAGASKVVSGVSQPKKSLTILVVGLTLWHVYIYLIGLSGIMQDFSLPPKGPPTLILPPFLFTGLFVYLHRRSDWMLAIPPHWLIFIQIYRIGIEALFVISVAHGFMHPYGTIEGYNFDMIFAASALIVGYPVYKNKTWGLTLAMYWNYLGLVVIASIIFVVVGLVFFPQIFGSNQPLLPKEFGTYPIVTVPGFLMPFAVFVHVLSLTQLSRLRKKS